MVSMENNIKASTLASVAQPPSESPAMTSAPEVTTKAADVSTPHAKAAAAADDDSDAPSGLDLLFAASQVENKPGDDGAKSSEAEADKEEVVSTVTDASRTGTTEGESTRHGDDAEGSSDTEKSSANEDIKDCKVKTFPQILHEILNTSEFNSIAHWLPDGLSFIIADKRRFSDEILPLYFRRVALFHSFIRKLNRYGFRKVKGFCKGEESSFAHNNFVRDKPWLCLKMNCKSKPSYHKVPSEKKQTQQAAAVDAANSCADSAQIRMQLQGGVLPSLLAAGGGGMPGGRSVLFPTSSLSTLPMTSAALGHSNSALAAATAAALHERQYFAHAGLGGVEDRQERLFRERQILMLQMRQQRHQRQATLQRFQQMSYGQGEEQFSNGYDSYVQSAMMTEGTRDLLRRNMFHH